MSKHEEILDMAVHALNGLMNGHKQAKPSDLFDEALDIAEKLYAKVEATAVTDGAPPRDELMDMGIHALSALLNSRQGAKIDDLLDESMAAGQALITRVDRELAKDGENVGREEFLDVAVHVQTALLNTRTQMSADELSEQCVTVAQEMLAKMGADAG